MSATFAYEELISRGLVDREALFLEKPFNPKTLAGKVREALEAPARPGRANRPPRQPPAGG
jgi:hypothetical protein